MSAAERESVGRLFACCHQTQELRPIHTAMRSILVIYSVSQKNPPLGFSENFSQTVGNF